MISYVGHSVDMHFYFLPGWGGYRVLQSVDKRRYDVTLISPVGAGLLFGRLMMVLEKVTTHCMLMNVRLTQTGNFNFTPLLAGAAVGTLEFRCATEAVRRYGRQIVFHEAWADDVDLKSKTLLCVSCL